MTKPSNKRLFWFAIIVFLITGASIGYAAIPQNTIRQDAGIVMPTVNATEGYWIGTDNVTQALWSNVGSTAYVGFDANLDYQENYYFCDGVNDDVQIQEAVDDIVASALNGGTVYLEAGLYDISTAIEYYSNIAFEGSGREATILRASNDVSIFTSSTPAAKTFYINIRNLSLQLNNATSTNPAINLINANRCTIQDLVFWSNNAAFFWDIGINIETTVGLSSYYNKIDHVVIGRADTFINIQGVVGSQSNDNRITHSILGDSGKENGTIINIDQGQLNRVRDCTLQSTALLTINGININNNSDLNIVKGSRFEGTDTEVSIDATSDRNTVENNDFADAVPTIVDAGTLNYFLRNYHYLFNGISVEWISLGGDNQTSWPAVGGGSGHNYTASTYIYWLDGGMYYAQASATSIITNNTNFGTLINGRITAASGGLHFLTQDTYELIDDVGITVGSVGTKIMGVGYDTVITVDSNFADDAIQITADNCVIEALRLSLSNQNSAYDGIEIHDPTEWVTGYRIKYVRIDDAGRMGVNLGDGSWASNSGVSGKIEDIVISGSGTYGIIMRYDCTDNEVLDFLIHSHTGTNDAGFYIDGDNNRITHGHLWGNYNEVIIGETQSVTGLLFNAVAFMDGNPSGHHRVLHNSSYDVRDVTFSGCEFWVAKLNGVAGIYSGIYFIGDAYAITVTGNVFRGELDDGTNDGRYAIYWDASVDNSTIAANTFRGFTEADPIFASGSNIEEGLNSFWDNG